MSTAEASNRLKSFLATEVGATGRNSRKLRDMAIEVLGKNTRVKQRVPGGCAAPLTGGLLLASVFACREYWRKKRQP